MYQVFSFDKHVLLTLILRTSTLMKNNNWLISYTWEIRQKIKKHQLRTKNSKEKLWYLYNPKNKFVQEALPEITILSAVFSTSIDPQWSWERLLILQAWALMLFLAPNQFSSEYKNYETKKVIIFIIIMKYV